MLAEFAASPGGGGGALNAYATLVEHSAIEIAELHAALDALQRENGRLRGEAQLLRTEQRHFLGLLGGAASSAVPEHPDMLRLAARQSGARLCALEEAALSAGSRLALELAQGKRRDAALARSEAERTALELQVAGLVEQCASLRMEVDRLLGRAADESAAATRARSELETAVAELRAIAASDGAALTRAAHSNVMLRDELLSLQQQQPSRAKAPAARADAATSADVEQRSVAVDATPQASSPRVLGDSAAATVQAARRRPGPALSLPHSLLHTARCSVAASSVQAAGPFARCGSANSSAVELGVAEWRALVRPETVSGGCAAGTSRSFSAPLDADLRP